MSLINVRISDGFWTDIPPGECLLVSLLSVCLLVSFCFHWEQEILPAGTCGSAAACRSLFLPNYQTGGTNLLEMRRGCSIDLFIRSPSITPPPPCCSSPPATRRSRGGSRKSQQWPGNAGNAGKRSWKFPRCAPELTGRWFEDEKLRQTQI